MIVKCKPVFNFQSIEFEMEVNNEIDFNLMSERYKKILDMLQEIAPEQQKASTKKEKKEEMSTIGQQNFLLGLGIPREVTEKMTKKEASAEISKIKGGK